MFKNVSFKAQIKILSELSGDHTGENLADILQLHLLDYKLSIPSQKLCAFTTDCDSNIIKVITNLSVQHVPCAFKYSD